MRIVLTAVGRDRPGIVAGVTRVLYEHGGNLEDSSMTRLEGEFAVILIVSVPDDSSVEKLRAAFEAAGNSLGLTIHLKALDAAPLSANGEAGEAHIISVYGADRPGIVYRVAQTLADRGVNISDVVTHRATSSQVPLYQLMLEVELPARVDASALDADLQALARELGVQVSLREMEAVEL
ncbi:MAG: ACT domain-containing protein [Armatimonadetes bacterium]|nr:ACT domain-containing protein [Armatimonadota bacterium]